MLYPCKRVCQTLGVSSECQNGVEPMAVVFDRLRQTVGLISSADAGEKERHVPEGGARCMVTIMFCDIRGFSRIAEDCSPDTLILVLNEHFTAMTESLLEYQGAVDKCFGDEFFAVFTSMESTEDAARRCVRAALAMQARNRDLNQSRYRKKLPVFSLGIGINTGTAIAGYVGPPYHKELTVVGDAVNVAQRLCAIAKPGQILAEEATHKLVKASVRAVPIGPIALRGKARIARAHEILSFIDEKLLMCT